MAQTLNQVLTALEAIATNHKQINSFGFGDVWDIATSGDINYPMMYVTLEDSQVGARVEALSFNFIFMDIVKGGRVNEQEVLSDQLEIAKDVIAQLQHPDYEWEFGNDNVTLSDFTERFTDSVAGFTCKITLLLPFAFDRCAIPYTPTTIPDIGCPVVTIYNSDGSIATTVSAGGNYTMSSSSCADATVRNSDSSYSTTVASGATLVLPNETITVNVNGVLNQTGTYIPLDTTTINITT